MPTATEKPPPEPTAASVDGRLLDSAANAANGSTAETLYLPSVARRLALVKEVDFA
jgi:hypothetical protein